MGMADSDSAGDVRADEGPLRTCAVTRQQHPVGDLIRFVASPDDVLVPDVACRLPGRGVWVSLDRKAVETAIKTRAFSRGLKRPATAAPELADLVDKLLAQRAVNALSIANKAGCVLTGFSKIDTSIAHNGIIGLVHGCDASDDGVEKLDRRYRAMSRDLGVPAHIVRSFTTEQMSLALGRANVVHAALTMGGAAQHFLFEAERLGKYRTGTSPGHP